ncbi:MAG: hypothetical protein Q8Q89_04355 [bacterium]|nr:hypothetical protein [bacterium]
MLELQFRSGFPEIYRGLHGLYVFEILLKDESKRNAFVYDIPSGPQWRGVKSWDVIPTYTVVGWRETYNCINAKEDIKVFFDSPGVVTKDRLSDAFARHINRENCSDCHKYYETKLNPEAKQLPTINKKLLCKVGIDWYDKKLFIGDLKGVDSEIAHLVAKELNVNPKDLHDLTCDIKDNKRSGITGADHLSSKVLKLKLKIVIEECELVDDVDAVSQYF